MTNSHDDYKLDVDVETTREMRDEAIALRNKFDDFIRRLDTILYNNSNSKTNSSEDISKTKTRSNKRTSRRAKE